MLIRRVRVLFLVLLSLAIGQLSCEPVQGSARRGLDPEELSEFADDFMQRQMDEHHIPGAALVIVQGDEVLLSEGYGMADLNRQIPVDADETVFRAGSISKLFTATAVMQLVEQGKLELIADINDYLTSLQLDDPFERPVTVADLLLHTAGFDEVFFGVHVRDATELKSIGDFLNDHLPARYVVPGEFISYNDHGYTLAGLLVEDVSGQSFDTYVAEQILVPLAMRKSTFTQPQDAALLDAMAIGYHYNKDEHRPYAHNYVQVSPAAALLTTATDMGNFITAHLNGGTFDGEQILRPETVAAMQSTQFSHHPALRGRGYGFSEWLENGQRAVFHDGGNPGFLNRLVLIPEENVGFFLTFNNDQYTGGARFHRAFTSEFLDAFYPEEVEDPIDSFVPIALTRPLREFQGHYRPMQAYSHDTFQRVASLMEQVPVVHQDETLVAFGRSYAAQDSLVFSNPAEESTIVFREDQDGTITHLFIGTGAFVKVPWIEAQPVQYVLIALFLLAFIASIVGSLIWRSAPSVLRIALALIGLLNLFFLVGLGVAVVQVDPWRFAYGPPPAVVALLVLPLIAIAGGLIVLWQTVVGWRQQEWGWLARSYTGLICLAILAYPLFLDFWNLLGFRY